MSTLMSARAVTGRPVVTLKGDDIAQVKDVVFGAEDDTVRGFTLSGRRLLSGPLRQVLAWQDVYALGPDAVMVRDENALTADNPTKAATGAGGGNVVGAQVISDEGVALGRITDVIIELGDDARARVMGYEIEQSRSVWKRRKRLLLPVPGHTAASGETVVVPGVAMQYTAGDLAGLAEAAHRLSTRLEENR
ncbi:FHA domain-containing protein [Streptomyces sp. NBRC 110611]|uniref:PRC-barrel domain-containing protein n=1 Tax=Streptomyces sp. NBRC 110611 TaxID=1621259 RepID=UPI00082FC694|nr:PRC-barrel domain-containing protein [Streptomyces sp. NBRC 110611]GAU71147.1 FHA domain-containing protein [Streptomyces sp. NBRC 110611]